MNQYDYFFYCLGAYGMRDFAYKDQLKESLKSL